MPLIPMLSGFEKATKRKIAIKKIKVGQFKDGLDLSAIREVKYLRELHHPNVIEVQLTLVMTVLLAKVFLPSSS
jgi:serine/threonine protein kinase